MAGLVAARQVAKVGMSVTLLEAADTVGGCVRSVDIEGVLYDAGADRFPAEGAVRELVRDLGLDDDIVPLRSDRTWIVGQKAAGPLPADTILGIPANPWSVESRRLIGWRGAWRAFLDRLRPPLTIGHQHNLATLVSSRMGDRVLGRMVAPLAAGLFGVAPEEVDVDKAAPGISAALTRTGSLGGAVGALLGENPRTAHVSLRGGVHRLAAALANDVSALADVRVGAQVTSATHDGAQWRVRTVEEEWEADLLIVATDAAAADHILAAGVPADPEVAVVTLATLMPPPPRSPRVFPMAWPAPTVALPGEEWEWVKQESGTRTLVRLIVPEPSEDEFATVAQAVEQATSLLGVSELEVVAHTVTRLPRAAPSSVTETVRGDERERWKTSPHLAVVGQWIAGSGLEQVVADSRAEADALRHRAIWGNTPQS